MLCDFFNDFFSIFPDVFPDGGIRKNHDEGISSEKILFLDLRLNFLFYSSDLI